MERGSEQGGLRKLRTVVAVTVLTILGACAGAQTGGSAYVENPGEWKAIDLAEADLNLPLVAPLEIASLERRVDDSREVQEIYTFRDFEGYVKTTRLTSGIYPEAYAKSLKAGKARTEPYIAELSLPPGRKVFAPRPFTFVNGKFLDRKSLSRGFTAEGTAPPYYDRCFVARTAYLLVDFAAVKSSSDPVDTVIEVLLCGDLPRQTALERMLIQVEAVTDRQAFRRELAGHEVGAS